MNQIPDETRELKRLRVLSVLIAILLGFLLSWATRYSMTSDSLSYIDIAGYFSEGDWEAALRPSWCPLFPFLVSIGFYVLKPTPYWEFQVLHLVNFLVYIGTIFAFDFFICELLKHYKKRESNLDKNNLIAFPAWALLSVSYTIFIFCSLHLIGLWGPDPDMCFAAFAYLSSGLVLKIYRGHNNWFIFLLLGVSLGFGYLAKTPMFILAFIYLGMCMFCTQDRLWNRAMKTFLALAVFILISTPYIVAISNLKGHFTFGESGKLNYAWYINDIAPFTHWQGTPGKEKPIHPTRKIFSDPPVYEFASPIKGTYPPFFDPSYWYDGIEAKFDFFRQICAIAASTNIYYQVFFNYLGVLVFTIIVLSAIAYEKINPLKNIFQQWVLLIPSLAAFAMFSLVHLEARYIAAFVVIFWIALLYSVLLQNTNEFKKLLEYVAVGIIVMIMATTATMTVQEVSLWQKDGQEHTDWEVANAISKLGIHKGDKIATIGYAVPYSAYWARLAKVQIISEITTKDADKFWSSSDSIKEEVIKVIKNTGAKAIVAYKIPSCCNKNGWKDLEKGKCFIYLF